MGTSPPSAHAGDVTESTGRGGPAGPLPPPGPLPPAGACAMTIAQDAITAIAESTLRFIVFIFIRIFSSQERSLQIPSL
jgi:hypothetical protein